MPAALDYHPPGKKGSGTGSVTGIGVAVDGIYRAIMQHARQSEWWCHGADEAVFESFRGRLRQAGRDPACAYFVPAGDPAALMQAGTLFRPDPAIASLAGRRRELGARAYSLVGISHTMSTAEVMRSVGACLTAPVQPWDAIVCPSRAIRSAIEALWEDWAARYSAEYGGFFGPSVRLPVIPLGIDTARFASLSENDKRKYQRKRLGVEEDAVLFLFHGRLTYQAKAHPLPMLLAAERAALATGRKLHLAFYGYFTLDGFAAEFRALAADICRTAQVHFVANDDPAYPDALWAGADVFVSLSDNIQESFGLTPIEAKAAGLPIVVSDWDGYRDTVRDGVDGFAVPTLAPASGAGGELARRYFDGTDTYGHYLAGAAQSTCVEVEAAAAAFARLASDPELRRRFGAAGRADAACHYDWRHVVAAYEALWEELAEIRNGAEESTEPPAISWHPPWPDPFSMFGSFPTRALAPGDRLETTPDALPSLRRLLDHRMSMFMPDLLLDPERWPRLVNLIRVRPGITVSEAAELLGTQAPTSVDAFSRTVLWLAKLDVVRVTAER